MRQTEKRYFGFIGRNQVYLFMTGKEYFIANQLVYADCDFCIKTPMWIQKLVWCKFGWANCV